MPTQEIKFTDKQFLDRMTLVLGETGTGKTTAMLDIIKQVSPHITQIIAISAMDKQNHVFDGKNGDPIPPDWDALARKDPGVVPKLMINYKLTPKLLEQIWERQMAFVDIYEHANQKHVLAGLFNKISQNEQTKTELSKINDARMRFIRVIKGDVNISELEREKQLKNVNNIADEVTTMIYKREIGKHYSSLSSEKLSKSERIALDFLDFKPHLLLIFDDCTEQLKAMKNHPVMQKLFTQARHAHITVIINAHSDKAFEPEQKKNAFNIIFTAEEALAAFCDRKSGNLEASQKDHARNVARECFVPENKHQKVLWVREDKKFYRFTAQIHPRFRVGSEAFREFCAKCIDDDGSLNSSNPFMQALLRR